MGVKKKIKRKEIGVRPKISFFQNSFNRSNSVKFINKPLFSFDLLNFVQNLGIKYFRGVFSRDSLPNQIRKECGIVNLDTNIGPGSHWVCYRNIDNYCEYFDSFGLIMPSETRQKYMATSGKQIVYSGEKIQERDSVLCGYWCLY